jgi:hypothetical protein
MATATQTPRAAREIRGYFRGTRRAAHYLDIDRSTFRKWRDDKEQAHRELLQPRIISGDPYYRIANLDRFMDPANNAPDAAIVDHTNN